MHGLKQSTRALWKYLTQKIVSCGIMQSSFNLCLFVGEKVGYIIYIDSVLFWARDKNDVTNLELKLLNRGVNLNQRRRRRRISGCDY